MAGMYSGVVRGRWRWIVDPIYATIRKRCSNNYYYCYCNAPEEIYKSPTLANVSWKSSEGFSTLVTSPRMPPKPARTRRKNIPGEIPVIGKYACISAY